MPMYKNAATYTQSYDCAFDLLHFPGEVVGISGIYRCTVCGDEIAANKQNPLPPQNTHQHGPMVRAVTWQLVAAAVQLP